MRHRGLMVIVIAVAMIGLSAGEAATPARLQSDPPVGEEIARRINARDEGHTATRTVVMELIDRAGRTRTRVTRSFRKDYPTERRTVIFFADPANLKGTGLLTYDYVDARREDDQWLYLPALRRVRRVSSLDRGSSFLGSDFTYEEIKNETKVSIHDYKRTTVGEEIVDGYPCYVVEAVPVDEATARAFGVSRVLERVDAAIWMPRKGEYWDRQGRLVKSLFLRDIRQVQGIWTAHSFEAVDHRNGHRSVLRFTDVEYNNPLGDDLFTESGLQRGS
jgi:outer membrane lipoprotein-sorting protein